MELLPTAMPGCYEVQPRIFHDERGRFVKLFNEDLFAGHGLPTHFAEACYSVSQRHVLRGLHFQLPPHEQAKLVFCLRGRVLDAAVDLRLGSPTYGHWGLFELDSERGNGVYIPRGFAHGFYAPVDHAVFAYLIDSVHAPAHDTGIRWDSAGIPWPDPQPILSAKDRGLPPLSEFTSPFRFPEAAPHA